MKFLILEASTAKEKWSDLAVENYLEKISHFFKIELQACETASRSRQQKDVKLKEDSEAILKKIKDDDYVILLDERGENLDSIAWSKSIEKIMNSGKKRAVFILGGAYGVDQRVKDRAQKKICLSPMVLNHLVARTVLLEQVYRSLTLINNLPYHNE